MMVKTPVILLLAASASVYTQTDPIAAIQQPLTAKYKVSSITADNTTAIPGSVLTLKKSGVVCAETTNAIVLANTYKDGKIAHGLFTRMANGAVETRTFVAGEKLWTTGIEVKPKAIVFSVVSDRYAGVRYRGSLIFRFSRGEIPSAQTALAIVGEVFDVEDSLRPGSDLPAAGNDNPGYSPETTSAGTPVQEIKNWDSPYGHITNDDLERINDPTLRFDLNYMRLYPAALSKNR